ncbi:MAG: cation diffusion facilitator family transporter [Thermoleophilia bacterium]|nr:cation diffusion facilitator family transporter [Thermoleophilia bacterium]
MGHGHDHGGNTSVRALAAAAGLILAFMVVEAVGGLITGSLALLADAGHMASDAASLLLALFAAWLATHPPTPRRSFGYRRAEILAALANGTALVAIAIWIVIEAMRRLPDPPEIDGPIVLVIGAIGLAVNAAALAVLWRSRRESLNVDAAFRHVMSDALGSVGVIVSALVIITTDWRPIDPILSLLIAVLIAFSAWSVLRESVGVLLEAAPRGMNVDAVGRAIAEHPGVSDVHDLHVWTITSGFIALSAHVVVEQGDDCHVRQREIAAMLHASFGIAHTTLQTDHSRDPGFIPIGEVGRE